MKLLGSLLKKHYTQKDLLVEALILVFFSIGCHALPQKKFLKFTQKSDVGPLLLKSLVERGKSLYDFKAFARTIIKKNDNKGSIKQAIIIRGADAIRIDVLSLFNKSLGIFIQKKNQVFLFDPSENKYYTDLEALSLIEKLLGIRLNFEEFIPLVSANIPFIEQLIPLDSWISEDDSVYKVFLKLIDSELGFFIEIDSKTQIPKKITKLLEGKEIYSVTWKSFKTVNGYDLPHFLEWTDIKSNKSIVVKINKPIPNTGIKDSAFNLDIPVN